jgi:hypothetical protein
MGDPVEHTGHFYRNVIYSRYDTASEMTLTEYMKHLTEESLHVGNLKHVARCLCEYIHFLTCSHFSETLC